MAMTYARRVWRYQRGNQNPYIEEEMTTQWPKEKVQKDTQRSTKYTHKTKDRVTRTQPKTGGELRYSGRVSISCFTSSTHRVNLATNLVISHEEGNDREVFTTDGTYPWSFLTILLNTLVWHLIPHSNFCLARDAQSLVSCVFCCRLLYFSSFSLWFLTLYCLSFDLDSDYLVSIFLQSYVNSNEAIIKLYIYICLSIIPCNMIFWIHHWNS